MRNNLIYEISYKILVDVKPLCIKFDKADGFIKVYDRARYLVIFGPKKYVTITIELDTL